MFHGLTRSFLYSAAKLSVRFQRDNKDYMCSGTGFFIKKSGEVFFITNRHILDGSIFDKSIEWTPLELAIVCRNAEDRLLELTISSGLEHIQFHPAAENDIAVLPLKGIPARSNLASAKVDYFIDLDFLATTDEFTDGRISIGDFIAFAGYPYIHDRKDHRPIMRMGTIASDPACDFSASGKPEGARLLYEGFSTDGSSGSPVFALMKGLKPGPGIKFDSFRDVRLVGINAGHFSDPSLPHSSLSYFYKSSAILEML